MTPFAKMNGLGNQIVVVDGRGVSDQLSSDAAINIAKQIPGNEEFH